MPIYDIVAADSRSPRDGRYIERVGQYNPLVTSGATMLDRERVTYWLKTGAQPTDTVRDILSREGILLAIHMEHKGASAEDITTAVDAHVMRHKSREAIQANTRKSAQEVAETEEEAPAAQAEEAPAAEAQAPATEETPAAEAEAPATEEAPAAEEKATEEAPAAEAEAPATEEAPAEESAEATEEEKSGE